MLGAALGALLSPVLPTVSPTFWPLICMGAILAGTMRAPLTALVFALELTGEMGTLLPLLAAGAAAHGFTVLVLRRSILTEKMARRGFHVSREYAIDPLEILFVRDVMESTVEALPAAATATEVTALLVASGDGERRRLYPALDGTGSLSGVVTRRELEAWLAREASDPKWEPATGSQTLPRWAPAGDPPPPDAPEPSSLIWRTSCFPLTRSDVDTPCSGGIFKQRVNERRWPFVHQGRRARHEDHVDGLCNGSDAWVCLRARAERRGSTLRRSSGCGSAGRAAALGGTG
jgi:CBS domain-containing protein